MQFSKRQLTLLMYYKQQGTSRQQLSI